MNDADDGPVNKALPENTAPREMTYGEKAVGLTFNPSGDPKVNEIKALFAQIIDICNALRLLRPYRPPAEAEEKTRLFEIAITEAQTAQMWAVKAITWTIS